MGFELTLVVIGIDCIGRCKPNYHTIMAVTAPDLICTIYNIIGVNALFKALLSEKYTIVPGQTCVNSQMFMGSET